MKLVAPVPRLVRSKRGKVPEAAEQCRKGAQNGNPCLGITIWEIRGIGRDTRFSVL